MPRPIYTVDAFTDAAFSGNPAAVCLLDAPADETWMQQVAQEMNLSETAFLAPLEDAGSYSLRWFTPAVEVPLCGHATLASAHALWTEGHAGGASLLRFQTHSGELTAQRVENDSSSSSSWIELDFPVIEQHAAAVPMELPVALGAMPVAMSRTRLDILCELKNEQAVRELAPDFAGLLQVPSARGIIATARADSPDTCGYDFVSRFFVPAAGIDEDPVTGSAHCVLAPYWAARLGKREMTGYQASSRGGTVRVALDGGGQRVRLRGRAVTTVRGELLA